MPRRTYDDRSGRRRPHDVGESPALKQLEAELHAQQQRPEHAALTPTYRRQRQVVAA